MCSVFRVSAAKISNYPDSPSCESNRPHVDRARHGELRPLSVTIVVFVVERIQQLSLARPEMVEQRRSGNAERRRNLLGRTSTRGRKVVREIGRSQDGRLSVSKPSIEFVSKFSRGRRRAGFVLSCENGCRCHHRARLPADARSRRETVRRSAEFHRR